MLGELSCTRRVNEQAPGSLEMEGRGCGAQAVYLPIQATRMRVLERQTVDIGGTESSIPMGGSHSCAR